MTTRVNLYPDPSFRDGLTHVTALNGATLSITTDYAFYGDQALLITKAAEASSGFSSASITVIAGLPYAISVYARLPLVLPAAEASDLVLQVQWLDASNSVIQTDISGAYSISDDVNWSRLSSVWTAPATAVGAVLQVVQPTAGTAGQVFIVDAILFEQAEYVGGFFENVSWAEKKAAADKVLSTPTPMQYNGLQLNADIVLNDLILNTIDEDGTIWVCTGLEGWWGQAEPSSPDIPRGTEDGSYDVSGRYLARIINLTGVFFPKNTGAALSQARDRLVTASNLVRRGGWLRAAEEPTKAAFVRLSGKPQISTVNARGRTEFSIGLKAGDPIKYEWNDSDPEGYRHVNFGAADGSGETDNNGTATVTAVLTLTGPLGAGSTVHNSATSETLTLIQSLRGAGPVATVETTAVTNNVATITTTANHGLIAGDTISLSGVGSPYDTTTSDYVVTSATQDFPYTINFALTSDDIQEGPASGTVTLVNNDQLIIDTYNRSVTFNGQTTGQRNKLETLTDWITIAPGTNIIEYFDTIDHIGVINKQLLSNIVTLTTDDIHGLIPGESVIINLPTDRELVKKSLTGNVVTLTTTEAHGYSVGDEIDVASVETIAVDNKTATTTAATLRTVDDHGITAGDIVIVDLPITATPTAKSLASNVVTLTTQGAHNFSLGDAVAVAMPTSATITSKALSSNQATLTTAASHGFLPGESITVALPSTASITKKQRSGSQAIITTSAAHGFSTNDQVTIALPTTATLTNSRSMAGSAGGYLATLNTSAAHNFSVGDKITVNIGVASTATITNRASSGTTRTLTFAAHTFSVGEKITVTGVNASYNGVFYITAVTSTTISYTASASLSESTTAQTGTVTDNTISDYYNGVHIVETIPTSTSLTFLVYGQETATSSTKTGSGATLTDNTNQTFNGTYAIQNVTSTTFAYNYAT